MKDLLLYFCLFIPAFIPFQTQAQTWVNVGAPDFSAGAAQYTSIAIDTAGIPYIVYRDVANGSKATVMKFNGSTWVTVGSAGISADTASYTTIAIGPGNTPYIAYTDYSNGKKATVMKYNGSSWVAVGTPGFSDTIVSGTTIAIGANDTIYIAYLDNPHPTLDGTIMVKKFNGSNWITLGDLSASEGTSVSLAVDPSGRLYVGFTNGDVGPASVMSYSGGSWAFVGYHEVSTDGSQNTNITIDKNGTPYVTYIDRSSGYTAAAMKYTGGTIWTYIGAGFSADEVYNTSIITDSGGTPYVAFLPQGNNMKATVMKNTAPGIWTYVGTPGFSSGPADFLTMAMSKNGILYVAFSDQGSTASSGPASVMSFNTTTGVGNRTYFRPSMTVFPNPTHNSFTLKLTTTTTEPATITITNIIGEKMKQLTAPTNEDTEIMLDTVPGIYFIMATTKESNVNGKIVLE